MEVTRSPMRGAYALGGPGWKGAGNGVPGGHSRTSRQRPHDDVGRETAGDVADVVVRVHLGHLDDAGAPVRGGHVGDLADLHGGETHRARVADPGRLGRVDHVEVETPEDAG